MIGLETALLTNSADPFRGSHTCTRSVWTASVNPCVSTAFIIIIIKSVSKAKLQKNVDTSLSPLYYHQSPWSFFFFFSYNIGWSHRIRKKKITCIFNFILHWLTQKELPPIRTPFGKVSIKSESAGRKQKEGRRGEKKKHFMSEELSKLLPDFKWSALYLPEQPNVLFLLLSHSLDGNQDRSTRTLSAAVTLQWQTAALRSGAWALFSTHSSPLSENKAGFMAAGKGGKHNKAAQLPGI